jgi:RNA polymerase sigma factor (sigma-70 family)
MSRIQPDPLLRYVYRLAGAEPTSAPADAELLRRFVERRDEAAFTALLQRHGGLVMSVCRRLLNQHDAEDAFQATFLTLIRHAASIRRTEAVGSWLYRVAHRVALKAGHDMARRSAHERESARAVQAPTATEVALRELQDVVDEEVRRLPEKYRAPFVLCCLEGKTRAEAARELGWKEGTVAGRLGRARLRLQERLVRRGVSLSVALTLAALAPRAEAALPRLLLADTRRAALQCAAGSITEGAISAPVAALIQGVTPTMWTTKLKGATALLVFLGLLTAGTLTYRAPAAIEVDPPEAPASPGVKVKAPPGAKAGDTEPLAEDKVEVKGRVLGPDGKPLHGAEVLLMQAPGREEGGAKARRIVRATSDTDGCFRFRASRSEFDRWTALVAAAPGYGPAWVDAHKPPQAEQTLKLVTDAPIAGRIIDLQGRPIQGAVVKVESVQAAPGEDLTPAFKAWQGDASLGLAVLREYLHRPGWAGIPAEVTTDADGRFRITGVGRERLAVLRVEGERIEHKTLYVFCRPGADVAALAKPDPEKRMAGAPRVSPPAVYGPTFEHPAQPCKPIVGVVKDRATGRPLAGVEVGGRAADHWWDYAKTKTDAEGRFRLVGLAKAAHYQIRARGDSPYLPSKKQVSDSEGLKPLTVDFEVARGVLVRGRVTDKTTGKPVECSVDYFPLPDNEFFKDLRDKASFQPEPVGVVTGKDGTFRLPVLPGSGVIMVSVHGEAEALYTEAVLDPAHKSRASDAGVFLGQGFVSASGSVQPLFGHQAYRLIEPSQGSDPIIWDIALDRGKKVTGTVVSPDGKPLAGATVYGLTSVVLGRPVSLKDASFTAQALNPARPRTVAFIHMERKLAGHAALGGDEKEPLTVKLEPWGAVTGRALDREGYPLADAECVVLHRSDRIARLFEAVREKVKTDHEGHFRVEGIFPGVPFDIYFVKKGTIHGPGNDYRKLSVKPGQTKDLGGVKTEIRE